MTPSIRYLPASRRAVLQSPTAATRRLLAAAIASTAMGLSGIATAFAQTAPASPTAAPTPEPSAIGNELVVGFAVSPLYSRTGLVVAVTTSFNDQSCGSNCTTHVWVTHDGGNRWGRQAAQGWNGVHPAIIVDASGREIIYASAPNGILRSADQGSTWQSIGSSGGIPAPDTEYAHTGAVAVAGKSDYVVKGSSTSSVPGSQGTMTDVTFAYLPADARTGPSAALLGGVAKSTGLPAVERCGADLRCSDLVQLPGGTTQSGAPNLFPSSDFAHDHVVFAQTETGVYKSTDSGATFKPLSVGLPNATYSTTPMLAVPQDYRESGPDRALYAAVLQLFGTGKNMNTQGGVFRSTDGGATWSQYGARSPLDAGTLAVAAGPDGRVFASYFNGPHGEAGLLCNADGGSWQTSCPPSLRVQQSNTGIGTQAGGSGGCGAGCSPSTTSTTTAASADATGAGDGAGGTDAKPGRLTGATRQASSASRPWGLVAALTAVLLVGLVALVHRLRRPLSE